MASASAAEPPSLARLRDLAGRAAVLVRRAILTIRHLPDRERVWLSGPQSSWPEIVRDAADAYGWGPAVQRFSPSRADVARCLPVLAWVAWLNRQNDGRRDVRIITARAFGVPLWKVAAQHGRSDDTIRRWETGAFAMIAGRFWREIEAIEAEAPG